MDQLGYDIAKNKAKADDPKLQNIENRLRLCIGNHRDKLLAMTVGLSESKQVLLDQLKDRVGALNNKVLDFSESKEEEVKIKLVSLDVDKAQV